MKKQTPGKKAGKPGRNALSGGEKEEKNTCLDRTKAGEQPAENSSPVCYAGSPELRPEYRIDHGEEPVKEIGGPF